jgi:hypothetical protein
MYQFSYICIIKKSFLAAASVKKGSNASEGFKMYNLGTFFYAQGLSKVFVEILRVEKGKD